MDDMAFFFTVEPMAAMSKTKTNLQYKTLERNYKQAM